jgi:hypothetical protein
VILLEADRRAVPQRLELSLGWVGCSKALAAGAIGCAILGLDLSIGLAGPPKAKKAGVVEHPEVFDHVGLLVNGPPGHAGLPFS